MQIPDFSQARILVVGDLMLDRYWIGPTARISPEAPVPVVKIDESEDRPGGAANVALNIATLGAKVTLLGVCGQDENASRLKSQLEAAEIACGFVALENHDTITKLRVLSRNQQLIRLDFEKPVAESQLSPLLELYQSHLADIDVVLLSDYAKGTLSVAPQLIALAKKKGIPVIVDPKGSDFHKYSGATLLTPNLSEFQQIVGDTQNEASLVEKAQGLITDLGIGALLVTRSEQGMTLLQNEQQEFHLPAEAKEVYDVTGAGDTVISVLAAAIAAGSDWREACALANAAAGIVVGKLGTATVTINELHRAINEKLEISGGVMSEEQLKIALQSSKQQGNSIVMTNGCFDILHAGHVSYLEAAKKLGDKLIVAVNADDSVTRLKGEGRPINKLDRRMAVLAGLGCVDWVVAFDEGTPQRLISELLPDTLVKGGDYKVEDIAGGREVLANGGEVKVLHFEDGISTTKIIQSIVTSNE